MPFQQKPRSDPLVTDFLFDLLNFTATRKEIIASTGLPSSTVDHILGRLLREKIIDRISRGTYKLNVQYKRITYSLRIKDTSSAARNKHVWGGENEDVEVIVEGIVPAWLIPQQIDDVLFQRTVDRTLDLLQDEGVLLIPDDRITFETVKGKGIIRGVEEIKIEKKYDPTFKLEVLFTNNIEVQYVFQSVFNINEVEFTS